MLSETMIAALKQINAGEVVPVDLLYRVSQSTLCALERRKLIDFGTERLWRPYPLSDEIERAAYLTPAGKEAIK